MHRADSFTGFGKRPDFTPSHQQVFPRGMILNTCLNRKNPVSGISYIALTSYLFVTRFYAITISIPDYLGYVALKMAVSAGLGGFASGVHKEPWQDNIGHNTDVRSAFKFTVLSANLLKYNAKSAHNI